MLGFKNFWSVVATITGIGILHMIKKGQLMNNQNYNSAFSQFVPLVV